MTNTKQFGPLAERHGSAAVGNQPSAPRIVDILFRGCPTNIAWLVVAIVVLSIELMSCGWQGAYLGQDVGGKSSKGFFPALANGNATPTVTVKETVVGVEASLLDVAPAAVHGRIRFAVSAAQPARVQLMPSVTAATCGVASSQIATRNDGEIATGAATKPDGVAVRRHARWANNSEFSKSSAQRNWYTTSGHNVSFHQKDAIGQGRTDAATSARPASFYGEQG